MEEHTKAEQFQNVEEDQLQAITGAGESGSSTPVHDKVVKLWDQHITHSFQGPAELASGNTSMANWHNEQANATLENVKRFYPSEPSPEPPSPVAKPKKGCFGCFGW
jgi:hypothetical protein